MYNSFNYKKCFLSTKPGGEGSEGSCDTKDWSNDADKSALGSQE